MGRFKFKKALCGLATVTTAVSIFAVDHLVDNHEDGTNENELERYWYYYDDFAGTKEDDRPTAGPKTTPSEILLKYKDKEITLDNGDKHTMKDYEFTVEEEDGNKFATMPFKYGETWTASYGDASPYVGIGTGLSGKSIDLSEATGFRFKMRARGEKELVVTFQIESRTILDRKTFDYHGTNLIAPLDKWKEFEVEFASLEQPGWTPKANKVELADALAEVVQLAWQVHGENNKTVTEGVLDIDDIYIMGTTITLPSMHTKVEALKDTTGLYAFATFEEKPKNQQKHLKTYWYAYDDGEIKGTSEVRAGATKSETTNRLTLEFEEETGSDDKGTAPFLDFKLGKVITREDGIKIKPFVGIGINVYDSATATYWDASKQDYIYFHYKTAGAGIKKATLEISDSNDVGDKNNPKRKEKRGSGVVWYKDLPNTNEEWKAVKIKFSDLVAHEDWDVYKHIPLVKSALAKIQFKVQGDEGTEGFLAIDNVYFGKPIDGTPVLPKLNTVNTNAFAASYRNGQININWAGKTAIAEGKISLFDAKGSMIQSSSIAKVSKVSDAISANALASGIYIVKLSGVDVNGNAISLQKSLNVLK